MKKTLLSVCIVAVLCVLVPFTASAKKVHLAPIDSGVSFLAIAGVAYVARMAYVSKKQ